MRPFGIPFLLLLALLVALALWLAWLDEAAGALP